MSYKPRPLDTVTLLGAADYFAEQYVKPPVPSRNNSKRFIGGRPMVMQDLYNLTFKDEFEFIVPMIREKIEAKHGKDALARFDHDAASHFETRREDVFEQLLEEHLAIRPDGTHIDGKIGKVQLGNRVVGKRVHVREQRRRPTAWERMTFRRGKIEHVEYVVKNEYWPVYAGELAERARGDAGVADPLPEKAEPFEVYPGVMLANNPRISNLGARAACDAIVDRLDLGAGNGEIRGRTGAQPADPDSAETGTLLFTLPMSATAFGAATDANPGGIATANAITDDSSADATGTLGYCRAASTGAGADDEIDGEAGTATADFIFNTLSITSGSTVSMSSFTVTVPES